MARRKDSQTERALHRAWVSWERSVPTHVNKKYPGQIHAAKGSRNATGAIGPILNGACNLLGNSLNPGWPGRTLHCPNRGGQKGGAAALDEGKKQEKVGPVRTGQGALEKGDGGAA